MKKFQWWLRNFGQFCLLFVLVGYNIAMSQGNPEKYSSDTTWRHEIQSVLDNQVEAWNNGNIAGYMDGYWKSDSLIFTSGGNIRRGWKETFEKYKRSYDTKEKMGTLKFSNIELFQLSPGVAWIVGHWELSRRDDHPNGVFTLILRRFPGGWKIIHDHTSATKE